MEKRRKVILHDLPPEISSTLFSSLDDSWVMIDGNMKAARCIGCFKCWLKTPGICAFSDKLEDVGKLILSSEQLVIITQMLYGGVSIPVKKVLDRCIPGVNPFFKKKCGKLHHLQRYPTQMSLKAIYYHSKSNTQEEKLHGQAYMEAMGINFHSKHTEVFYIDHEDFSGVSL